MPTGQEAGWPTVLVSPSHRSSVLPLEWTPASEHLETPKRDSLIDVRYCTTDIKEEYIVVLPL